MSRFLFMGEQDDPEFDAIANRGLTRIYDATEPRKYGLRADDGMGLPAGKTCSDCAYFAKCKWLISARPDSTRCDWAPSRFSLGGER